MLVEIQASLFAQAKAFLTTHTIATSGRAEFFRLLEERAGMIEIAWCERADCEAAIKAATSATSRNLRRPARAATCVACGEPATAQAYFAQSY